LIPKECIFDVAWRFSVQNDLYHAAYHLSDLMIDEALADYVEYYIFFI